MNKQDEIKNSYRAVIYEALNNKQHDKAEQLFKELQRDLSDSYKLQETYIH